MSEATDYRCISSGTADKLVGRKHAGSGKRPAVIGANIAEAKYGNGPADFANKMHTALKECNETKFWLELFAPENEEQAEVMKKMKRLNGNIMRMLIQSLNTVKARADWKR